MANQPANLAALTGTEAIKNSLVSIGANGALAGAGGGQVTIGGLGFTGDLNATNGAPVGTLVGGTAAATVVANAANGQSAFSGTAKYRTAGAPTNAPSPTGITTTANANATLNIRLDWAAYTQGANQADFLLLFWRRDGNAPTVNDAAVSFNVNTAAASYYVLEVSTRPTPIHSLLPPPGGPKTDWRWDRSRHRPPRRTGAGLPPEHRTTRPTWGAIRRHGRHRDGEL